MQTVDHFELLKNCTHAIELSLHELGLAIAPDKKANLIALLYKHFLTSGIPEKKKQAEPASTTEGPTFICDHQKTLDIKALSQLPYHIILPSIYKPSRTGHEERLIHKISKEEIESISLLLRPDHGIPVEYLSGAVLDYAIVTINHPAKEGNCIRGQILSEDYPDKPLLTSIPLSQIAGFEQSPKEVK